MHHHHHAVAAYRAAREVGREVLPPTGGAWVWRSRALVARVDLTAEADEALFGSLLAPARHPARPCGAASRTAAREAALDAWVRLSP